MPEGSSTASRHRHVFGAGGRALVKQTRACRGALPQSLTRRSRSALPTTDTELRLIAAAASIGLRRTPSLSGSSDLRMPGREVGARFDSKAEAPCVVDREGGGAPARPARRAPRSLRRSARASTKSAQRASARGRVQTALESDRGLAAGPCDHVLSVSCARRNSSGSRARCRITSSTPPLPSPRG